MPRSAVVALLAVWGQGAIAGAEELPAGLRMHRQQAGKPDASGWAEAASSEGAFTVRVPCPFNDFTVDDAAPEAVAVQAFVVGCVRPDGVKFSATRVRYRRGAEDARALFKSNGETTKWPGAKVVAGKHRGLPVVDVVEAERCVAARFVLAGDDGFALTVEGPSGAPVCQGLPAEAGKFFESLAVRARGRR